MLLKYTVSDIIAKVDALEPNQYDTPTKIAWLSNLDGQIYEEVIKTHFPDLPPLRRRPRFWGNPLGQKHIGPFESCPPEEPELPEDEENEEEPGEEDERSCEHSHRRRRRWRWPYFRGDEELLAGSPYGEDMYCFYLQAMIADQNSETAKYNRQIALYNNAYQKFAAWYNRTHMPKGAFGGNRYRY